MPAKANPEVEAKRLDAIHRALEAGYPPPNTHDALVPGTRNAKDSGTGWWWVAWNLHIQGGRIQGHQSIPMMELEARYGSSD